MPRRQSEWEEIREGAGNSVFDGPPSPFDVWGHGDMMSALTEGGVNFSETKLVRLKETHRTMQTWKEGTKIRIIAVFSTL